MRYWSFVLSLILTSHAALAESVKISDLIEMAVSKNLELKAARLTAQAQRHFADQASAWDNPNFEIEGQSDSTRFGLSQQILFPRRLRNKIKVADAKARLSELDSDTSNLRLRHEVLQLIFEYRAASEKASHAQERLERFRTIGAYLRSRVFASPQKQAEATIVRTKLLILGREFRQLEARRRISWNQLNLYLGLNSEPKISEGWFTSGKNLKIEDLVAKAQSSSPFLREQELRMQEAEADFQLARSEVFPGFALKASYSNETGADREKIYGVGVSFPIPIWNWSRAGTRGADNLARAERERLSWARQKMNEELKSALEQYNAAKESIEELRGENMIKFEKDMRTVDQGFKKGQVDLLTYIEADAEHFDSLNAFLDSQIDFIAARSHLYEQIGEAKVDME